MQAVDTDKLEINPMARIGEIVQDLVGTPFLDGGRDQSQGLDCWGVLMVIGRRLGWYVPEYTLRCFDVGNIAAAVRQDLTRYFAPVSEPEPGAVVMLALDPAWPGSVQHFGVAVDRYRFIHTTQPTGCIISPFRERYWRRKMRGFYRCNMM